MNMPYQPLYWRRVCDRYALLLLGIVIGLSGVPSAGALTGSTTLETSGLSPGVPGLDQAVGAREFRAGLVAFDQGEFVLARHHWAPMARLGHADSQFYMGLLHDVSVGIRPDARQAIRWYRLAAEQGVAEAQQKLALGYARGEGVDPDMQQAVRWWLRAARQGHANAQYNLGMVFVTGHDGIARDIHKAIHWWRQAALAGDSMAQYKLGALYVNGKTAQPDFCLGLHWWRKSQRNGLPQAGDALAALRHRFDAQHCLLTGP